MAKKLAPSAKQKSQLMIHAVVFVIANILLWYFYDKGGMRVDVEGWAYPWPSWITAAWALALIGHWAALFTNYEDPGNEEYIRQAKG